MHLRTLVDGGYLSWVYGTRDGSQEEWDRARGWYGQHLGSIILMDHTVSNRAELDAAYKSRRIIRRAEDPAKAAMRKKVHDFAVRDIINDFNLYTLAWPGLEADDLVALFAIRSNNRPISIVGVDKDLLQLPFTWVKMKKINDERVFIANYARRLPQAIRGYVRRGRDVLLCLALMGDKSDSVGRLIPPRDFQQMIELLHHPRPFRQAARWFGSSEVGRNVYLTVLPGPWVYNPFPSPEAVMDELDDGTWWHTERSVAPKLAEELEKVYEHFAKVRVIQPSKNR